MNMILTATAALAAIVAATSAARAEAPATFTLAFGGIATPTGAILVSVFDSEAAFDGDGKPVRQAMIPATAAAVETLIEGLPAGRYGVKAFHDVDGDGQLAVNPFGMPTEPFAFSNNAVGNMGPARWADAAFTLSTGANRHTISIR
jgi:uncharacterized protein (DUF2141 family)